MKLTDYLKAFRVASQSKGFSANTRSLYYALLEMFDENFYPAELFVKNVYLMARSGITSTSSFDRARDVLINSKLITCRKGTYGLKLGGNTAESQQKENRKVAEMSLGSVNNIKNKDTNTNTAPTTPTATNARASDEVMKAWDEANGVRLKGEYALKMCRYENQLGTENLIRLIKTAGAKNSRDCVSVQYLEAFVFEELKGQKRAVKNMGQYAAIDECPV